MEAFHLDIATDDTQPIRTVLESEAAKAETGHEVEGLKLHAKTMLFEDAVDGDWTVRH